MPSAVTHLEVWGWNLLSSIALENIVYIFLVHQYLMIRMKNRYSVTELSKTILHFVINITVTYIGFLLYTTFIHTLSISPGFIAQWLEHLLQHCRGHGVRFLFRPEFFRQIFPTA